MLSRIRSAAVLGIDAYLVDVEVDIAHGLPSFATVGLPQGAIKEGKERVNAAVTNSGFEFPLRRITVNLAPADVRKDGSAFDLPIALGVLAATGQLQDGPDVRDGPDGQGGEGDPSDATAGVAGSDDSVSDVVSVGPSCPPGPSIND